MTTDDSHPADADEPEAPAAPPGPAGPVAGPPEVPDEQTLESIAAPASVRRAPRIGAFVRTGVLLGALLGWLLAILFTGTTGEGRTGAILISTAGLAGFGALLGAAAAALADRRSVRSGSGAAPGSRSRSGR